MAEKKVIELEIESNLGSLKEQLAQAKKEVQDLANQFGNSSQEVANAADNVRSLEKEIKQTNKTLKSIGLEGKFQAVTGSITGALNGIQAVQGSLSIVGVESGKVEEALLKVQSAMALADGIEGVFEAQKSFSKLGSILKANVVVQKLMTAAQYLYNAAMAASPIGAIVLASAALIAVGYKLVTMFQESAEMNDEATAAVKRNTAALNAQISASDRASESIKNKNSFEYDMAKASGQSADALRKLALKHADEEVALEKSTLATARNTYEKEKNTLANYKNLGVSDDIIEKQRELVTKSREALKDEYKDLKEAYKNRQEVAEQNQVELKQEQTNAKNDAIDAEKEKNEKIKQSQDDAAAKSKEALEEIAKNQRAATDLFKLEYDKQVRDITEKYDAEIALAKKYNKETVDLEKAKKKELQDLEDAQAKDLIDNTDRIVLLEANKTEIVVGGEKKRAEDTKTELAGVEEVRERIYKRLVEVDDDAKKKRAQNIKGIEDSLSIISDLTTLFAGKSKKQQEKAFKVQKAVNVASAIIDTYKAANAALASAPPPLGFIAMGAAIAAGLVNIKKITSTQFQGGENPPATPPAGTTAGTSVMSPNFNVVGNSGINQLAQLQQTPTKAYVVSGDMTTAQSLDRNRIENATLVQ